MRNPFRKRFRPRFVCPVWLMTPAQVYAWRERREISRSIARFSRSRFDALVAWLLDIAG